MFHYTLLPVKRDGSFNFFAPPNIHNIHLSSYMSLQKRFRLTYRGRVTEDTYMSLQKRFRLTYRGRVSEDTYMSLQKRFRLTGIGSLKIIIYRQSFSKRVKCHG